MKNYLLWGRFAPGQQYSTAEFLLNNRISSNTGNLLFNTSVCRALMTPDVRFTPFFRSDAERMAQDPASVNEAYDGIVIPLANAFRSDFIYLLKPLTRLIRAVKLPCYVIGVGLEAGKQDELSSLPFNDDVKDFVSAVLEKSPMLGLRGEYTAQYLSMLGYREGEHFRVIGCPSAYLNGPHVQPVRIKPADEIRRVAVNYDQTLTGNARRLMQDTVARFDETNFVAQTNTEMWFMHFGHGRSRHVRAAAGDFYPADRSHPFCREGRMRGFLNARSWVDYLHTMDLSVGSRIHGNIAAMLAGTPALIIARGLRIRELAEFYGIPYVPADEIPEGTDILKLYEAADFGAFERKYPGNFANFVDFLNLLGLDNIYADPAAVPAPGEAPFDIADARVGLHDPIVLRDKIPFRDRVVLAHIYYRRIRRHIRGY